MAVSLNITGVRAPVEAWTVTPPATVPNVIVSAAVPVPSVIEDADAKVALPEVTSQFTVTPGTGFPPPSVTSVVKAASFDFTVSVWASPPNFAMFVGAPGVAVARKVTFVKPADDTVIVSVLATAPRVHEPRVAIPDELVVGELLPSEPFPLFTVKNTATPFTGFGIASVTSAAGAVGRRAFTCAVWLFPALTVMNFGLPAVAVALMVTGLPVRTPEVAVIVLVTAAVPRVQLPTVAIPEAFVTGDPPVRPPPPAVTAKVTETPDTGLPWASVTSTDGAMARVAPTVSACPPPALSAMILAAPCVAIALKVTGDPISPPTVAVTFCVSAVSPRTHCATAMPLALVIEVGGMVPVPLVTAQVTVTPLTGFTPSVTSTESRRARVARTVSV